MSACSPNITTRELYRFTTEELFEHEMDDMDMPGWTTNFIYDEFHPDPVYENTRVVEDELMPDIFTEEPMSFDYGFDRNDIVLNNRVYIDYNTLKEVVNPVSAEHETG